MNVSVIGLLVVCGIGMLACVAVAQPIEDVQEVQSSEQVDLESMEADEVIAAVQPIVQTSSNSEYTHGHNGKPGCRTAEEVNRAWRNNVDPTRFWYCEELNVEATEVPCPINGGFMDGICVPWYMWEWTPPFDPPTMA